MIQDIFSRKSSVKLSEPLLLEELSLRYEMQRVLYQAPHAVAYDAEDLVARRRVVLWTYRDPIPSETGVKIVRNLVIPALKTGLPSAPVFDCGVAGGETVFYSTQQVSASPLLGLNIGRRRKGLLAARIIRYMAHLHESKTIIGCLHRNSFLATREEYLYFNGFLPVIDTRAILADSKPVDLEFAAPELRSGSTLSAASDVFSTGAFIYRFLGGHDFPSHLDEQQLYQHLRIQLPVLCAPELRLEWLEPILHRMLQWRVSKRYTNAQEVFKDVAVACPELGVFGAGTLKKVDNAAASYIMSPFTRAAVGLFCCICLAAVLYKRSGLSIEHSPMATIQVPTHTVDLGTISELAGTSPISLTNGLTEIDSSLTHSPGEEEAGTSGNKVFYDIDLSERKSFWNEKKPEDRDIPNTGYKQPDKKSDSQRLGSLLIAGHKAKPLVKKIRKKQLHFLPAALWTVDDDSALVQILETGTLEAEQATEHCPVLQTE